MATANDFALVFGLLGTGLYASIIIVRLTLDRLVARVIKDGDVIFFGKIAMYAVWPPVYFFLFYLDQTDCFLSSVNAADLLYFSFTTFTTLGYGDIQPMGICRAATSIEAISGYVCLGMLINLILTDDAKRRRP